MIGYPFTNELFKNVLSKSKAISGRFFICPNNGREINTDELGQIIQDLVVIERLEKKYPISLMLPPVAYGHYKDGAGEWEQYMGTLFFLTPAEYSGTNQVLSPNINTRTSQHTILYTWHDMKRCALNFCRVLDRFTRKNNLINTKFRLDQERQKMITPVTNIGVDKACGVKLDFSYSQLIDCTIEDYTESEILSITIPSDDSHPEHQL